jgi:hypothetical protein
VPLAAVIGTVAPTESPPGATVSQTFGKGRVSRSGLLTEAVPDMKKDLGRA